MRLAAVAALAFLGALAQDPARRRPPQPPPDAPALPQVSDRPMTEIERKDLWQQFVTPSPIAGFYRLRAVVRGGAPVPAGVRGYLVVGQRHLAVHLHDESASPGRPAVQASVRGYVLAGSRLQMTSELGVRLLPGEAPVLEGQGLVEIRDVVITATTLRVVQSPGDYLEFERIE